MFSKAKPQQPQTYQPQVPVKGAPVMRPDQGSPKDAMRRQMMAQMLMQQPFQNPQMVQPQFQPYSPQGY